MELNSHPAGTFRANTQEERGVPGGTSHVFRAGTRVASLVATTANRVQMATQQQQQPQQQQERHHEFRDGSTGTGSVSSPQNWQDPQIHRYTEQQLQQHQQFQHQQVIHQQLQEEQLRRESDSTQNVPAPPPSGSQSSSTIGNGGRFSTEEQEILVSIVKGDPDLCFSFLHRSRSREYAKNKSWMTVIAERFNQRTKSDRHVDAVRHHLNQRRSKKDSTQILLWHAMRCRRRPSCTKCLQLDRTRVELHFAKCGLVKCSTCKPNLPFVFDAFSPSDILNFLRKQTQGNEVNDCLSPPQDKTQQLTEHVMQRSAHPSFAPSFLSLNAVPDQSTSGEFSFGNSFDTSHSQNPPDPPKAPQEQSQTSPDFPGFSVDGLEDVHTLLQKQNMQLAMKITKFESDMSQNQHQQSKLLQMIHSPTALGKLIQQASHTGEVLSLSTLQKLSELLKLASTESPSSPSVLAPILMHEPSMSRKRSRDSSIDGVFDVQHEEDEQQRRQTQQDFGVVEEEEETKAQKLHDYSRRQQ